MEVLKILDLQYSEEQIKEVAECFRQGGVVVYPTDTVYGIGCSTLFPEAVERVYRIKQRDGSKPLLVLVSDLDMARDYFYIKKRQMDHLKQYWPGPASFLLNAKKKIFKEPGEGVVVRLPKNDFLIRMIERVGDPITSTSLNVSGEGIMEDLENIDLKLDTSNIDMMVDAGRISGQPSSIFDIRDVDNIKVIRK